MSEQELIPFNRKFKAEKMVNDFRQNFRVHFGMLPRVIYNIESMDEHVTPLEKLEEIANELVKKHVLDRDAPDGIRTKSRIDSLVSIRNLFVFIAVDQGYILQTIADYLGYQNHSSSVSAAKRIENLLEARDVKIVKLHAEFFAKVKQYHAPAPSTYKANQPPQI